MAIELFVDESCRTDYLLCAAAVPASNMAVARRRMRDLKPNNRDRLHMHAESRNRDRILSQFLKSPPIDHAHVFVAVRRGTQYSQRHARKRCLEALGRYAADHGVTRVLIESCSQDKQDLAAVVGALASRAAADRVGVFFDCPTGHELLWAADLVAWAYGAGGATRAAIAPLVKVHRVDLA